MQPNEGAQATVEAVTEAVRRASGLDENQAKAVVYFAIATYGLPRLQKFPILAFQGPAGTGKSTLLDVLGCLAHEPRRIDGKMTKPVMRDELRENTTALIEEADGMYERVLVTRYARQTSATTVKREARYGFHDDRMNLFGATALHRRQPFKDHATLSRAIVIRTRRTEGVTPFREADFKPHREMLKALDEQLEWERVPGSMGDRIHDTWAPLLFVAERLGDQEWLEYAGGEMEKAAADLKTGQEEEPTEKVYQALLRLALHDCDIESVQLAEPKERVAIADVTKAVQDSRLNPWQVGKILRDLGFEVGKRGGIEYVYTGGRPKLAEIGTRLGIQDEWVQAAQATAAAD